MTGGFRLSDRSVEIEQDRAKLVERHRGVLVRNSTARFLRGRARARTLEGARERAP
jgi:hypothetical protein